MRAEERGAPSASLLEAAALLPGTPGPAVSCRWGQRHRVAPALPQLPPQSSPSPEPRAPAGLRAAPAPPPELLRPRLLLSCMSYFLYSFPPLFFPPPFAPLSPTSPFSPPFFSSFLFFCFFSSSTSRLPRAAARWDGAVGCSRWRAAGRGARGSSPGSRPARGVRAGTQPRAEGRGARGRAGRPCCAARTRL